MTKQTNRLFSVMGIFTLLFAVIALSSSSARAAGTVTLYNTSSDAVSNSTCASGDLVLNPGYTKGSNQGSASTFYCLHSTDLAADITSAPKNGTCPNGQAGYSLGGFGDWCITAIVAAITTSSNPVNGSPTPTVEPTQVPAGDTAAATDIAAGADKFYASLQKIVDVLTGTAGIVITGMLIVAGIQYSMSGGNPQAAAAAKKKIRNAVLATVVMLLMFSFIQWLVPGGIFSN